MGISAQIKDQQGEAAAAFGRMIRRWRTNNGWTQYTGGQFAAGAEPPFAAPAHGSASEIETGKNLHPRSAYFLFLGQLNRRVAAGNYKGIRSRKLLDQLKDSRAIEHDDGIPWGAADFWSCHAGILPPPDWLADHPERLAPQLSDDEAAALGHGWKAEIIELGAAAGLRPTRAVMAFVRSIPVDYQEELEEGLMGSFGAAELAKLWNPATGEWLPLAWISRWRAQLEPAEADVVGLPT